MQEPSESIAKQKQQRTLALASLMRQADEGIDWKVQSRQLIETSGLSDKDLLDMFKQRARLVVLIPCIPMLIISITMCLASDELAVVFLLSALLSQSIYCWTLLELRKHFKHLPLLRVLSHRIHRDYCLPILPVIFDDADVNAAAAWDWDWHWSGSLFSYGSSIRADHAHNVPTASSSNRKCWRLLNTFSSVPPNGRK